MNELVRDWSSDVCSSDLSKSRVTAGIQCAKQLWWRVHEPGAVELVPDAIDRKSVV